MQSTSPGALLEEQLSKARSASSGRSAETVYGGQEHDLRQTVIALAEGRVLGEHVSPGRHDLPALTDAAVLLPVATGESGGAATDR